MLQATPKLYRCEKSTWFKEGKCVFSIVHIPVVKSNACRHRSQIYMTKFKINSRLPSLNDYINKLKSPKGQYEGARMKRETDDVCILFINQHRMEIKQALQGKSRLHFEWHEKSKRRDLDNVYSAKKYILDALQKAKLLENDNPSHIIGLYDAIVYDGTDCVVVTIYDESETAALYERLESDLYDL